MSASASIKRQNFNVTAEEEAELQRLREALGAASVKDALLRSARVMLTLARELGSGKQLHIVQPGYSDVRVLLPDVEAASQSWTYLTVRPHSWKRQLFIKGRRTTAANVWFDMLANEMSTVEAADNWNLPIIAIEEIVRYCEANQALIGMEADEERCATLHSGVPLSPINHK
jgi:hypothetical protein